jgi:hypothetical protein
MTHLSTKESIELIGLLIFKNVLLIFLKNNKKQNVLVFFLKIKQRKENDKTDAILCTSVKPTLLLPAACGA